MTIYNLSRIQILSETSQKSSKFNVQKIFEDMLFPRFKYFLNLFENLAKCEIQFFFEDKMVSDKEILRSARR